MDTPHEHDAPCLPCRQGRHGECIKVRRYGDTGNCRYVCHCDHRPAPVADPSGDTEGGNR